MNHLRTLTAFILLLSFFTQTAVSQQNEPLYKNKAFALYSDRVVQNGFTGKAISRTELQSDYKSPVNENISPVIEFKFSINGKDNEMKPGMNHKIVCTDPSGACSTPVIRFGHQYAETKAAPAGKYLKPETKLTIRLDLKEMLHAFDKEGYYTTYKGDKIYKQDFKGVYVAGSIAPLIWDFDNLVNHKELQLNDDDHDGIYEAVLVINDQRNDKLTSSGWKLSKDVSAYPQYSSPYPISDAVYNLALEEMLNAVEPDSTFRTGKEWAGVWTRDISYSIILSMAYMQPQVARYSLLRKVSKKKKIIQDTGTGGAWPVSTDRMIWAVAAWEVYKATGDDNWLRDAYEIVRNSLQDDYQVNYDSITGLVKGESSFLDWREQTYPKWMQPADIFESFCLGTNAVHYQANMVLAEMADMMNDTDGADRYRKIADRISNGINQYLWMDEKGYYGQFLYGRQFKSLSPRSEALGEALTVLFGIAAGEHQSKIVSNVPVMDYGIPCIYPEIPNIPPYHNNAVWPFVQTYWALASAKANNEAAVMESIAAIYRPSALFVTNKENLVASTGDFAGTQINSSNMLWSLSGSIALVHKVLFGIHLDKNGLTFQPFVPAALKGKRTLRNFKYRNCILDIEMDGFGNNLKSFSVDGTQTSPFIRDTLRGHHTISISLGKVAPEGADIHQVPGYVTCDAPVLRYVAGALTWKPIKGAASYIIMKNGNRIATVSHGRYPVKEQGFAEYSVTAVDGKGVSSFASEPLNIAPAAANQLYQAEQFAEKSSQPYKGYSGNGFVEISKHVNTELKISIDIASDGLYSFDFRYSNGSGPVNTENKCAIRTLKEEGQHLGTFVFPQRGKEEWSNWGYSNPLHVRLNKGKHMLVLSYEPANENMNGEINMAMLDYMRIIKID